MSEHKNNLKENQYNNKKNLTQSKNDFALARQKLRNDRIIAKQQERELKNKIRQEKIEQAALSRSEKADFNKKLLANKKVLDEQNQILREKNRNLNEGLKLERQKAKNENLNKRRQDQELVRSIRDEQRKSKLAQQQEMKSLKEKQRLEKQEIRNEIRKRNLEEKQRINSEKDILRKERREIADQKRKDAAKRKLERQKYKEQKIKELELKRRERQSLIEKERKLSADYKKFLRAERKRNSKELSSLEESLKLAESELVQEEILANNKGIDESKANLESIVSESREQVDLMKVKVITFTPEVLNERKISPSTEDSILDQTVEVDLIDFEDEEELGDEIFDINEEMPEILHIDLNEDYWQDIQSKPQNKVALDRKTAKLIERYEKRGTEFQLSAIKDARLKNTIKSYESVSVDALVDIKDVVADVLAFVAPVRINRFEEKLQKTLINLYAGKSISALGKSFSIGKVGKYKTIQIRNSSVNFMSDGVVVKQNYHKEVTRKVNSLVKSGKTIKINHNIYLTKGPKGIAVVHSRSFSR